MSAANCGAGTPRGRTTTWDSVAVVSAFAVWLVVARPTYAVAPSAMVSVPMSVHFCPSDEVKALTFVPMRAMRTQRGAVRFGPAVPVLMPPPAVRRWNAVPAAAETSEKPWAADADSDALIITPVFYHFPRRLTASTRAIASLSPVIG